MGTMNWQLVVIMVFLFLILLGFLLASIQVTNPITQTPTSLWDWFIHQAWGVIF